LNADAAPAGLEEQLDRLEAAIARLTDGSAPLEELVSAYEEAARRLEAVQARLDELTERALRLSR
jgi:exodeoxyribonuclease VII small subunit